ncbi:MAG: HU family DNA-binding protein [Bacteroidaceae bacterium]|nr:HU family DNA-binding protein [Bacteroidaceae bacterium]MBQ2519145.1 HU family DNA-binding protein [Bacteroidaceae bacterium]MBQ3957691.1 HU family DNA-binding protein [Bacteroidaceae bacterium]MBQ3992764.1 HU family DNA-binding protein [Bacteroidaceae bacterium]
MNNKEFIAFLSEKNGTSTWITAELTNALVAEVSAQLEDENTVSIAGFGAFEVKKKLERVLVNPATKQRMLVPPKIVVNFKPNNALKDKAKSK